MRSWAIAIVLAAAVAAGCGGGVDDAVPVAPQPTTIAEQPRKERCVRPEASETLVTRETGGFSPHSTLVVRRDGFAWASAGQAFGGPRCHRISARDLGELRSALAAAELEALEPEYRGSTAGPEGMVVEIDTAMVKADGVAVYAESNAHIPDRLAELLEQLGRIEGLVVEHG